MSPSDERMTLDEINKVMTIDFMTRVNEWIEKNDPTETQFLNSLIFLLRIMLQTTNINEEMLIQTVQMAARSEKEKS